MLQVVKHRNLRTRTQQRGREAGIQQHVQAQPRRRQWQGRLLPKNANRPRFGANPHGRMDEIRRSGNQVRTSLAVGEDEILVHRIDLRQRRKQRAQVDLGTANPAGDQIKRVDSDAQRLHVISGAGNPACSRLSGGFFARREDGGLGAAGRKRAPSPQGQCHFEHLADYQSAAGYHPAPLG